MSLPSQSARGSGRSAAVSTRRRRKSPVRSALPFLIVAVLVVIVWFTMRPTGVRTDEPAAPPVTAEASPDRPAPTEITQGATRSSPGGREPVAPPRMLSGTQEPAPDEVDRALTSREAPRTATEPTRTEQARTGPTRSSPSGQNGSGGVLSRALEEPTRTTWPATNGGATQSATSSRVRTQIDTARRLVAENDRVGARALLSRVLRDPGLTHAEANLVRDELTEINQHLVFGRVVDPNDPITEEYVVRAGDSLSRIASRRELATHWRLIQRVNGLSNPSRIRLDQKLKLVRGPFHAVVTKSDFRMDIWHGPPSDPSRWVYIRSFDVGLGEDDGTPLGQFVVSANKLENPGWVNPRNPRERYEPNDPNNPIGNFWLGLDGVGEYESITGYGIHGTIEPSSIGRSMSMGCIRLGDDDIALVFELLAERVSRVEVRP